MSAELTVSSRRQELSYGRGLEPKTCAQAGNNGHRENINQREADRRGNCGHSPQTQTRRLTGDERLARRQSRQELSDAGHRLRGNGAADTFCPRPLCGAHFPRDRGVGRLQRPSGGRDKQCRLVVRLIPAGKVTIEEKHTDIAAAVALAADRAGWNVGRELKRRRDAKGDRRSRDTPPDGWGQLIAYVPMAHDAAPRKTKGVCTMFVAYGNGWNARGTSAP